MVPLLSQWIALPVERRMRTYCGTNHTRRHHLQPCWSRASPRGKSGKRKQTGSDTIAFFVFSGTTPPVSSRAFRKFVISFGRFFGHRKLGYREQSIQAFSRPFGKETRHANAHCSPHYFIAQRLYGPASFSPSPFHATITGPTCPHCLKSCRAGQADQPQNQP